MLLLGLVRYELTIAFSIVEVIGRVVGTKPLIVVA